MEIFKKIGQKELTKVGLQELYNFKVENPHVDLEPFWHNPVSTSKNILKEE